MNTVCDFLSFEMDSSSLGSPGGRLRELGTWEVDWGCPWEGSGFRSGRNPAETSGDAATVAPGTALQVDDPSELSRIETRELGVSNPVSIRKAT